MHVTDKTAPQNWQSESAYVLFGFERPANTWAALNIGSAAVCEGFVLDADVREHLGEGC